jgi:carboxyl-terminal processing protease
MRLLLPGLLAAAGAVWGEDVEQALRTFTSVYAAVEREAAEPPDAAAAIYAGAIPAMLKPLDPHSVFLDPNQFEQLTKLQQSVSKGFGSVVSVRAGGVTVLQALEGTPSAKAGLLPGDQIIAINDIALDRLSMDQLVGLLTESRQRPAKLHVRRAGTPRTLEFTLTPEDLQSPSVERAFFVRPGLGYVRISSFDAQTAGDLKNAIEKLGGRALRGLILDLRNNPGGLLGAALETASLFLEPGRTLVTVRGRAVAASEQRVPEDATPYRFPVAVLVNEKSASAAEIVAGALQDHDRAVVVGSPSYGKGLVETVYPLSDGAGLALTTAFYYPPSGRSIQRPLASGQLRPDSPDPAGTGRFFSTGGGRTVAGGGGIQPDRPVVPKGQTRLQVFLEYHGAFQAFATDYLRRTPGIQEDFEVTPRTLDEFQAFVAERQVLPAISEWSALRDWIRNRLKTEIFNQALGVEKGDEVEAQSDEVILAAIRELEAD